jgi:phosphoenolpyruvate carboxylase
VLFYLSEVLYRVVPDFYEELADALAKVFGADATQLTLPPILAFGTWVGGDMDGNPDVTGKTIRETLARQQQVILLAYHEECQRLAQRLSQSASRISVSSALSQRIEEYTTLLPGSRTITPTRHDRMPYRVFLAQIALRLRHTYETRSSGYESAREFSADVQLIAESLRANRGVNAGYDSVQRLRRRIDTFGFHLATLDVRQHTSVHHEVLGRGLDDPLWRTREPGERQRLLGAAIESDLGPRVELDPLGRRTRGVFEAIMQGRHRYGSAAVGSYIVSGTRGPDDVLAVLLLARWAEAYDRRTGAVAIDVAPLFDTIGTLEESGEIVGRLLADPVYRSHLEQRGSRQYVLIGYAQSAKEGGLCAARVATHQAQRSLARVLGEAGERHVLFHARGGSTALGGGRIDAPVRAAPCETVNGVLRITEQGDIVNQSYGLLPIAMRTLERAFNALASCTSGQRATGTRPESAEHVACARTLAQASRSAYRALLDAPGFYEYFCAVTPIDVIERMQIGSRPAFRPDGQGLDALRPVSWVFAWTQPRHLLPGWYGAGSGLSAAIEQHGLPLLQDAYASWFFLHELIDAIEAMLARTDLEIAQAYQVLAPAQLAGFFEPIRAEYAAACAAVLRIKSATRLLDSDATLQRSIQLRNPYVDPMNLMQIDLLQRWRASDRREHDLFQALLASISGIAQGLQSTG